MGFNLVLVLPLAILGIQAKIYSKCEFAKIMKSNGITNIKDLGTWTCVANYESEFNTKAINTDTGDYGILQISSKYWCSDSNTPGKGCHITCNSLLGDDITPDIKCAKTVFAEFLERHGNGFLAWVAYKHCHGDQTSWISECGFYHSEM